MPGINYLIFSMYSCPHFSSDIIDNPNQGMWYALQLMDPEGMFILVLCHSESSHTNQSTQLNTESDSYLVKKNLRKQHILWKHVTLGYCVFYNVRERSQFPLIL